MSVEGTVVSVLTQFLSDRLSYVVVDGCRSILVNVVSGVNQTGVFGPQLFLLYNAVLFSILENIHYGNTNDSTLVAVVPSSGERVSIAVSLNHDNNRVCKS